PRALRDYYLVAGRVDQFNQAYYNLEPPGQWERASGKVVFLADYQSNAGAGVRANDPAGDDPPVFWAYFDDDKAAWRRCHKQCSEFLVNCLYEQAVSGAMQYRGGAEDITSDQRAKIEDTWPYIAEGFMDAFGKNGQAVCIGGNGDLHVGGRRRKDFDAIV